MTVHVSKTATNGYSIGNDGTADGTKALPYLTVEAALAAATAETIMINDGEYALTGYLDVNTKPDISFVPENDYLVTLKRGGGASRVIHQRASSTDLYVGAIILDADGGTNVITTNSANVDGLVLDGTYLINAGGIAITSSYYYNLVMKNYWKISSTAQVNSSIVLVVPVAGNIHIYDGTIEVSGMTHANGTGISVTASVADVDLQIYNITATIGVADATPTPYFAEVYGCTSVLMHDIIGAYTGTTTKTSGLHVGNNATACTTCQVYDNTLMLSDAAHSTAGIYSILVGADATGANNDSISGVEVNNNKITGGNHGLMFGWIDGAKAYGNTSDLFTIGAIMKGTQNCIMSGNLIKRAGPGGAMRVKAGRGSDTYANNTHIMSTGFANVSEYVTDATVSATYANNIIYSDVNVTKFHDTDAGTVTVTNCNYYTTGTVGATSFSNGASDYATVALFVAGEATVTGCTAVDPDWDANYNLNSSSTLVGTGSKWWTGANPVGVNGEPFSDWDTDIGAIQSTFSPFHPKNL